MMKRGMALVSVLVLLSLGLSGCGTDTGSCDGKNWTWCDPAQRTEMQTLINDARRGAGLSELSQDLSLFFIANEHSKDLACHNLTGHIGSDGRNLQQRIEDLGDDFSDWRAMAENCGYGHPTARQQFDAWMASSGHHDNILGSSFREMGIACIEISGARYSHYWTAVFLYRE